MTSLAHTTSGATSPRPMHPLPPRTRIQSAARDELIDGILGVMRRTWRGREIHRMRRRLEQLDIRSLRDVAYRHGAFEEDEWAMTF